jgi:hypothetical protein
MPPNVYFAGPVDYIEHRESSQHVRDNWRHRFFEDLPINLFCPTCLNQNGGTAADVMRINTEAQRIADFFVGYFPGDAATFGTPVEVWEWRGPNPAVLIHPARPGVFVEHLQQTRGLVVVRQFMEARQWLQHRLTQP